MAQQVSNVLLISYTEELQDGKPLYVSSNCLPIKESKFEPAGHSFHSAALRLTGFHEEDVDRDDSSVSNDKENSYVPSFESYSGKSKKKSGTDGKQQDHYALLGLANLRYLATEEQIRKSYRDVALKYHPDKQAALLLAEETEAAKQAKKDDIENHFKAIQEAYEVLIDPLKRRIYDSTDEFDDEIPTDCTPQDFYKVFGPAFMRNSRWSVHQPAPSLGDDNTTLDEVDRFYNFWYSFKSWREFPHADEFDLEQAESRDHKRWMERQNAKLTEKARKEEYNRVRTLVDNAYKRDPRVARRKELEKAEKQRKKQAKYLAKKLEEEEAARAAEEERRKKEEEERKAAEVALQNKKAKEKEKKLLRKERSRLRSLAAEVASQRVFDISADDVESLCMSLDMEQLRALCDKIEGKEKEELVKLLKGALSGEGDLKPDNKVEEKQPQQKPQQTVAVESNGSITLSGHEKKEKEREKPWAKEEIDLLRKGMQKFPKGTSRRWEVISEYIGTGRSVEEILKAQKTVLLQKPDSSKAFDSFLENRKPAATIASPLSTREEVQGVPIVNGTPDTTSSTTTDSPKVSSSSGTQEGSAGGAPPDSPPASSASSDQDVWSSVQERALVQALKTFPKETPQRWERVATAVPGKSVNQCKKKFASLKETFRNKKTG